MLNNVNPNAANGNPNDPNFNGNNSNKGGHDADAYLVEMIPPTDRSTEFDPEKLLINLNEKHKDSQPILFRDDTILQSIACLMGKFKPNVLLTGLNGVGKTAIPEDIARRLANDDDLIPDKLKGYQIWSLPISNIMSGSGLVGDVEKKIESVIEFASNPENKVILFIDEIHQIVGSREATYDKVAQILKPALSRGDIKVFGATTSQEYQNLRTDPAFNRRFTRLPVDELSVEQTIEVLISMIPTMTEHYDNKIALRPELMADIVAIADEFHIGASHRPDNAITLLDRTMSFTYVQRKKLEHDAEEKAKAGDTSLKDALAGNDIISLSKQHVKATALKIITGNSERKPVNIKEFTKKFDYIKGQNEVIKKIVRYIKSNDLNLFPSKKPLSILLAGKSGVGKSEMAKIAARYLTGLDPITMNMTDYQDSMSITNLKGSSKGYVGYDEKTENPLDILETNPYQVILIDEIEKAHSSVQRYFMTALDEGFFTIRNHKVDCSKAIIFATTNAGHTTKSDTIGFTSNPENEEATIAELREFFDSELLGRFTKIVNCKGMSKDLYTEILADKYRRKVDVIKKQHPSYTFLPTEMPDEMMENFIEMHYEEATGARSIEKNLEIEIEDIIMAELEDNTLEDDIAAVLSETTPILTETTPILTETTPILTETAPKKKSVKKTTPKKSSKNNE